MLALLLLFIPNLKAVCFVQRTWAVEDLIDAIYWINEQNLQRSSRARKILMDLSRVCFLGGHEHWRGENTEVFMQFATLPSMRTIFGRYVEGLDQAEVEWAFPHHTSNITEIILQHSVIKAQYLSKLLVGIKALKRFDYDRQVNVDDGFENLYEDCPMETHQIIGALLEHTKQSLEYLSLTGGFHLRTGESDIHPCKGSPRDLEVVNEVVLNNNIYVEQAS